MFSLLLLTCINCKLLIKALWVVLRYLASWPGQFSIFVLLFFHLSIVSKHYPPKTKKLLLSSDKHTNRCAIMYMYTCTLKPFPQFENIDLQFFLFFFPQRRVEVKLILTYWDLSNGDMLTVFKLSSRAESKSCSPALTWTTLSFTKMLTARNMKETNRCMWM